MELSKRWLFRARRLAPEDKAVALALATVLLAGDPEAAAALASEVTAAGPVKQAWVCLAAAYHGAANPAAAMAALEHLLSNYTVDADIIRLAEIICPSATGRDWCGVDATGRLVLNGIRAARIELDGQTLSPAIRRLPRDWVRQRRLSVCDGTGPLVGSPIRLDVISRLDGLAAATPDGGLSGWCWQPAAPEATPKLILQDRTGRQRRIPSGGPAPGSHAILSRRWAWSVAAAALAGYEPPFRVVGPDGHDLLGSPIDPMLAHRTAEAVARTLSLRARPRVSRDLAVPIAADLEPRRAAQGGRMHPACVVIPVHDGGTTVSICLETIISHTPRPTPIVLVDDGSTDAAMCAQLDRLGRMARVRLVRLRERRGFPAAANAGLRAAAGHDVVLLNSDALPPPGWLARLREAAYTGPDIGTVSPLSNDATILNYPGGESTPPPEDIAAIGRLALLAARANGHTIIDVPTTVGFCMYIKRDCLDDVGLLRENVFAQGYGEENDFCLRAHHLGWRHVAAVGSYVAHAGGASFGNAKRHLIERNLEVLEQLHPGWLRRIEAHAEADPLFDARRRIDLLRWRAALTRGRPCVVIVTHDDGGGVERVVGERVGILASEGRQAIVLRPARAGRVRVCVGTKDAFPDLRYSLPAELPSLASLIGSRRPQWVEYHHTLGHDPSILDLADRLGVPHRVHVHDYALLCPRITLVGRHGRYCGEPDTTVCDHCVTDTGRIIDEEIDTAALRRRSEAFLDHAEEVVVPSPDTAERLLRHFPATRISVRPHEVDHTFRRRSGRTGDEVLVAVVGALGMEKGYQVLLDCARDAADRTLPLRFVLIGHSIDDTRLLRTGRCFVTGPYREGGAASLVTQEGATVGFIPSVWPETWCFALSELWRAGVPTVTFDIGAPAERIRRAQGGLVVPLGIGTSALNTALLAASRQFGHV